MQLRSGRSVSSSPGTSQFLGTMPDPAISTPNSAAPTIKILHQNPSFRLFSAEDDSHSALDFLNCCEDAMANSNVTDDRDKISFVRSFLAPDSEAARLMSAAAFDPRKIKHDYKVFKEHFLEVFGLPQSQDSLHWIFRMADALTEGIGSFNYRNAQAATSTITREAMDALEKSSWAVDDALPMSRLHNLLEIILYVHFLSPAERRVASSISFGPEDLIVHYATKLAKKLREAPKPSPSAKGPSASVAPVQVARSQPVPSAPAQNTQAPRPLTCNYCSKSGHTADRCYRRKREKGKLTRSNTTPPSQTSRKPSATPASSHPAPSGKWCLIHELCNHTTEACRSILRLKEKEMAPAQPSSSQSGEASRPPQHQPS